MNFGENSNIGDFFDIIKAERYDNTNNSDKIKEGMYQGQKNQELCSINIKIYALKFF